MFFEKLNLFRIQLQSFWYTTSVSTTFLPKVFVFKFLKWAWPKRGVAMILTIAAQAQNIGTSPMSKLNTKVISGVKSFLA